MPTSLLRAFQRHQEHNLKHPSSVDLITTKKQTASVDRLAWHVLLAQVLSCPQLIFPSKTWAFWNLFEFSVAEIT
jgi:hypothetical protein